MARTQHVKGDPVRRQIEKALAAYAQRHHGAQIAVKRRNPVAVRIRVIDPAFRGLDELKREELVWEVLDKLPDQARAQITLVVMLTPEEKAASLLDHEFETPTRSRL